MSSLRFWCLCVVPIRLRHTLAATRASLTLEIRINRVLLATVSVQSPWLTLCESSSD